MTVNFNYNLYILISVSVVG